MTFGQQGAGPTARRDDVPPTERSTTAQAPTATDPDEADERLPSITEQMAEQLGGWRGLVESSVPIAVFVICNVIWDLSVALIAAVGVAVGIAVVRLAQRRPIRHAVNGLFGIGIGALLAWRTGEERDFYLPGILYGIGYGLALLGSVVIRQPLVGWIWSVLAAGGRSEWRTDPVLIRTFNRLTVLWGVVWLLKVGVQAGFYLASMETALGVSRLLLGYPPYAVLLAITVWVVRRVNRQREAADPLPAT
ncbi:MULTISPECIES: DUF3159 domain-containing protein [unclassified Solwaraspora]|uniref:DUF3159 domain-containing protein n=1 Tax=unclassified Solwaraspora TaxID=2627926 RepID=UPI00259BAF1C|nr:DUF3159 domain-containing protein [Solwaraspora sp. WMMA2056]WJK39806.1 DUF3159 domain-containing protein [Solwaraspora sp. WMMA2056]